LGCNNEYSTRSNLADHLRSNQNCINLISQKKIVITKYICNTCKCSFKHKIDTVNNMNSLNIISRRCSKCIIKDNSSNSNLDINTDIIIPKLIQNNNDTTAHFNKGKFECISCSKKFSTQSNLNRHKRISIICDKWEVYINTDIITTKLIQNNYDNNTTLHFNKGNFECISCSKKFSTQSNLNRHKRISIICDKWEAHLPKKASKLSTQKDTYNINNFSETQSIDDYYKKNEECSVLLNTINYTIHEPSKDNLIHVIWNLFLCDKYQKIDQELIDRNGIGYIITILPYESDYITYIPDKLTTSNPKLSWEEKDNTDNTLPHYTIEYLDTHDDTIDTKLLTIYQDQSNRIEEVRKQKNRNIIILCNNGYQRSIPFICYYLLKYHPDEYSSLINVLQLVLGKVQGKPEPEYMDEYLKLLPKLCELFKSSV